jgi:hypothetical protein
VTLNSHSEPFLMYSFTWCPVSGAIIIPIWFIPVSATWSRTYPRIGLLAKGISCLANVNVNGRSRVPLPPLKINAFTVGTNDVCYFLRLALKFCRNFEESKLH